MKYDFDLDLNEGTSTGKIIAHIEDHKKILEFGPGNGRMTKYLTYEKKCNVSIVEFDEELFNEVMQVADDGFLGNIEDYKWCDYFKNKKFDIIIFADVLEHLFDPEKVLITVKNFLEENGKILITFPNIGHNALLIDLFNGKFTYRKYGLLDETHHTFYMQDEFKKLFEKAGLYIHEEDYTYAKVEETEFENTYEDLPCFMRFPVKLRPYGEVYQYFFKVSSQKTDFPVIRIPKNSNKTVSVEVLFKKKTDIFIKSYSFTEDLINGLEIEIPEDVDKIRVYPMSDSGIIKFSVKVEEKNIKIDKNNAIMQKNDLYYFLNQNPFFEINCSENYETKLKLYIQYIYIGEFDFEIESLLKQSRKVEERLQKSADKVEHYEKRYKPIEHVSIFNLYNNFKYMLQKFKKNQIVTSIDEVVVQRKASSKIITISGWGYSKNDNQPLKFLLPNGDNNYYKLVKKERNDVSTTYNLNVNKDYGFKFILEDSVDREQLFIKAVAQNGQNKIIKIDLKK